MITAGLVRIFYVIAITLVSISGLILVIFGVWVFQYGWLLGILAILASPVIWLFEIIVARIFLEFVINQFKISEHLKAIRDREGLR